MNDRSSPPPASSPASETTTIVVPRPPSEKALKLQESLVNHLNEAKMADPELQPADLLTALTHTLTGCAAQFRKKDRSFEEMLTNIVGNVATSFTGAHRQILELEAKTRPGG